MKFRYILKNKHTGILHKKIYTLNQIQEGGLSNLFDVGNYAIIAINQFTGLIDKNGKEIYEGDVLEDKFRQSGINNIGYRNEVVIYDNKHARFDVVNGYSFFSITSHIQVVGNIHENSDLLK